MSPFAIGDSRLPIQFWSKVDPNVDGCWEWNASKTGGYGMFYFKGESLRAHRLAYATLAGAIEPGLQIDHLCRNRACCNPAHLEPVTQQVNILRGFAPAAIQARQTHCLNGHELSAENIYPSRLPRRVCKLCAREAARLYKASKRSAA